MKTKHPFLGELSGEMLGTAILVVFGCGVVAQVVAGGFPKSVGAGDHNSIAWGWGLGVTMAVFVAGRISGAHLNPAVTVALTVFRGFERRKVLPFIGAQMAGAFLGALIVRFVYADQIAAVDPGHTRATQGIFSTSPGEGVSIATAFADQIVGTALLVMVIFAVTSAINNPPMANMGPVIIGLLVVAIGMAWGTNAGYAINPARDFGPDWPPGSAATRTRCTRPTVPSCTSGYRSSPRSSADCWAGRCSSTASSGSCRPTMRAPTRSVSPKRPRFPTAEPARHLVCNHYPSGE